MTDTAPDAAPSPVTGLYRALAAAIDARDRTHVAWQAVHSRFYGDAAPDGDYWDAMRRRADPSAQDARKARDEAFCAAGGAALHKERDATAEACDRLQRAMAGIPATSLGDVLLKLRVACWEHGCSHARPDPIVTGSVAALADLERLVHVDEPPLREYDAED